MCVCFMYIWLVVWLVSPSQWCMDFFATVSSFCGPDCMTQSILTWLLLCSCARQVVCWCQPSAEFAECVKQLLFPLLDPAVNGGKNTPTGPIWPRVFWARMRWARLKRCSRLLCAAEIGFTWVGDQTASADFLIKLNEERGKSKRTQWLHLSWI